MDVDILWDTDDDEDGNVWHCAEHGVTKQDVDEVFDRSDSHGISRSSGRPLVYGYTSTGRYLVVVYDKVTDTIVRPVTAFDVPERRSQ